MRWTDSIAELTDTHDKIADYVRAVCDQRHYGPALDAIAHTCKVPEDKAEAMLEQLEAVGFLKAERHGRMAAYWRPSRFPRVLGVIT